ncbi:class II histone deacetylase [Tranquillimonas alkanivorans]|uniref:Acetoin utilization deacetylase AcuC n=1 Tax=Tranquillimonas alkanivorans TaxID=441119 RepID=A0A1I5TG67_9RHOB|nr:class II histone deacetylase [Tranquillimonas alkanivorans]SFP81396.1 Acetoin utilization deacetylase AcuC [Tranquillimonas alkanivorans]
MTTGFFWDERCFWHGGGNYAFTVPAGGLVQPTFGGLPEAPETKRRLKSLMDVTGLTQELDVRSAPESSWVDLERVHPLSFLETFKAMSDEKGGELGSSAPFLPGGFEIAARSAGLAQTALQAVLKGEVKNAYALSRPPGHHCLPEWQNGFCLLANIAVAVEAALAETRAARIAVIDWDVHHGNGTEAIFYGRDDVLTISLHQERNYPTNTGDASARGEGKGEGFNVNIPLPAGTGHTGYLAAFDRIVAPALSRFRPDAIVVACGFDAALIDPLGRMLCTAGTFRELTRRTMQMADDLCDGRLVMTHEGGYSEMYVPFCGHAVIAELSGSAVEAPDPQAAVYAARQPGPAFDAFLDGWIDDLARLHA